MERPFAAEFGASSPAADTARLNQVPETRTIPSMPLPFSRLFRRSPELTWIEIDDLSRAMDGGDPLVLIDVREPEEFSTPPGHLPGALNVPLGDLPNRLEEVRDYGKPVVLVCKTDRRSARAAVTLLASGLPDVAVLRGGTDGWHERGLPLE